MAGFCRNCGRPLADGQAFCDGCGTPAAGPPVRSAAPPPSSASTAPPAQRPQAAPQPRPHAPAPQAAAAAPAKSGNTLLKVLLIFVVVIFLFGAIGVASIWYVAHRAKQKIHEMGLDDLATAS